MALEEYGAALPAGRRVIQLQPHIRVWSVASKILTFAAIFLFVTEWLRGPDRLSLAAFILTPTYLITLALKWILGHYESKKANAIALWEAENPAPEPPKLKEFHDPTAVLSRRDQKILEVFDFWPGYPPFWNYVRGVVMANDRGRCQITGCPSRTELHVHHKVPISEGGSHRIDNLVTLCVFHHGLQPDLGHERVWGEIKTQYFSMVRAHFRNGRPVRAHYRRRELASRELLQELVEYHELTCTACERGRVSVEIDYHRNVVNVTCMSCLAAFRFDQKLPEETGPQMAETLIVNANPGRWQVDFGLMQTSRKPGYRRDRRPSHSRDLPRNNSSPRSGDALICPKCGKPLRKRTGRYGEFFGCTGYPGCRYTRDIK